MTKHTISDEVGEVEIDDSAVDLVKAEMAKRNEPSATEQLMSIWLIDAHFDEQERDA